MLKKIFILSLTLCVIFLISWGVYYLSFKKGAQDDPSGSFEDQNETERIIEKITDTIEIVHENPVLAPILDSNGSSVLLFAKNSNILYRLDPRSGEKEIVTENIPSDISEAHWSDNRTEVMIRSQDRYWLYNTRAEKPVFFKDDVVELTWDSLSEKILYVYKDPSTQERSINRANSNGSSWEELVSIGQMKVSLASVPRSPNVAFWPLSQSVVPSTLKQLNLLTDDVKILLSEKYGADYLWSSDGKKILVSYTSQTNSPDMNLAVMNNSGGEFRTLSNTPTLVSKCAWSKDVLHVYCAIPTSISQASILPDDYDNKKFFTKDTFWKINTQTGTMNRVVEMQNIKESFDATNLFLSGDESILYFVERKNDHLYKIKL